MKAKYFKKLRSQCRYYNVSISTGLFGNFMGHSFDAVVLARNPYNAAHRAHRRGIGISHGHPGSETEERWGCYRVIESDKPYHWRNITYFK